MPNYDYECLSCGHVFEKFQQMSDKRLDSCPKCGKKVKRLIGGGGGIIFKGAGFYATDYRKASDSKKHQVAPPCKQDKKGCDNCPHAH